MAVTCAAQSPVRPMAHRDFEFHEPASLAEALDLLAQHGPSAALLSGGTDLVRRMRLGMARPKVIISLGRLSELRLIQPVGRSLAIGSLANMAALGRDERVARLFPALAEAAAQVGSAQVRNRATIGGNLCNASPCADTAPPAYVHDAEVSLQSTRGERRLALSAFMTGPGQTARQPDELLVRIHLPDPGPRAGSCFLTLTRRKAMDITIASATARISLGSDGAPGRVRLCLGSVAPTPVLSPEAERELLGSGSEDERIARAARAAVRDASPIDDLRAQAEYRRLMIEVLARRALKTAWARAREKLS